MSLTRGRLAAIFVVVALPLLAGCVGAASPEGWAPPVLEAGTLYASFDKGELSAVAFGDANPARVRWTFPNDNRKNEKRLEPQGIYAPPILAGDRLLVATHSEGLFALNASDGSIAWHRKDLGDTIVGAFARAGADAVAVGTSDGRLHLLKIADGSAAAGWPRDGLQLNGGIWATLVTTADTVFAATMKGEVHSFNLSTAAARWSAPFRADGAILDLALLPNGRLFVPSLDRKVYLVDAATGVTAAPPAPIQHWVWMQPAVAANFAYFGDLGGTVYSLDITTGAIKWTSSLDSRVKATPIVRGNVLVVADRSPAVHFFDTASGERLNTVPIEAKSVHAPLVPVAETALVLSTDGKLFRATPAELSVVEIAIEGR